MPVAVTRADTITVPSGYTATTFIPWGTPITGRYPAWLEDASNTAEDQAQQVGMHHDGMHFFPMNAKLGGRQSDHGLLVLNHEYIDAPLLHRNGPTVVDGKRVNVDEVRKEINAHGVSVVEIRRGPRGEWSVLPTARNRRVTGATPMRIEGPARGHALMRTRYSPSGTSARGTLNNCANGFTPEPTSLARKTGPAISLLATPSFRVSSAATASGEPDAMDGKPWQAMNSSDSMRPASRLLPKAITATSQTPLAGWWKSIRSIPIRLQSSTQRSAVSPMKAWCSRRSSQAALSFCYSGDDSQNEYIYKYVSRDKYRPQRSDGRLLDDGVPYVARFNPDGSGDWLALDHANPAFQRACKAAGVRFADQERC